MTLSTAQAARSALAIFTAAASGIDPRPLILETLTEVPTDEAAELLIRLYLQQVQYAVLSLHSAAHYAQTPPGALLENLALAQEAELNRKESE